MIFHHHSLQTITQHTAQFILQQLRKYFLEGETLLLLSGGSAGKEVAPLFSQRFSTIKQLSNLTVGLVDERFGSPWHRDSNMLVIKESGLTEMVERNGGKIVWPLQEDLTTTDTSVKSYNAQMTRLFRNCKGRTLGVFGIGEDGHTAGIKQLPKERFDRLFVNTQTLVTGYQAEDYERITLTLAGISHVTTAVVFATGAQKQPILEKLAGQTEIYEHEFPAAVFRRHKNVHIFMDQAV